MTSSKKKVELRACLLAGILFVCSSFSFAGANSGCPTLKGSWIGETFQYSTGQQRTTTLSFLADGTFVVEFLENDGNSQTLSKEEGTWVCEGDELTLKTLVVNGELVRISDVYEILELNSSYLKYRPSAADCGLVSGDCKDTLFEMTRVQEAV